MPANGFSLDRFDPAVRGSEWFTEESLDLRGDRRFAFGVVLDYAREPLVIDPSGGDQLSAILEDQAFLHVGAAVVLDDRARLAFNLPLGLLQQGDTVVVDDIDYSSAEQPAPGDLRLSGELLLSGAFGEPYQVALGARLFVPTGSPDSYSGDGSVRLGPRLLVAGTIGSFTYATHVGVDYRARDQDFAGVELGSDVAFGAAAGARLLHGRLVVGPELFGSTVIAGNEAFSEATTPFELLLGGHYSSSRQARVGLGVGRGLTRAFGSPDFRLLASLEFSEPYVEPTPQAAPTAAPLDGDRDGLIDGVDICPSEAGPTLGNPRPGCPLPDSDGDRIVDAQDACPLTVGGKTKNQRTNGCPPPADRDHDGVVDPEDACPELAGIRTASARSSGCPPPRDRDQDGILNDADACPDMAGPAHESADRHGCPMARVEADRITLSERVVFAHGSAAILEAGLTLLEAVRRLLEQQPDLRRIEVQGHTDNLGDARYNRELSQRRAEAVMKWLVEHGVEPMRLTAKGFGPDQPAFDNRTEEGRRQNRRVEFAVIERDTDRAEELHPEPPRPLPPNQP